VEGVVTVGGARGAAGVKGEAVDQIGGAKETGGVTGAAVVTVAGGEVEVGALTVGSGVEGVDVCAKFGACSVRVAVGGGVITGKSVCLEG